MKTKSFSKLLVVMVIVAFVISAVSGISLMAETFEYDLSANQDGSIIGTLDTETGLFTIEGTGEMINYSSSSSRGFNGYRNKIKTVTISDGITNIPDNMFYDCQYITSITIPDSVTVVGNYAFYKNQRLTSLSLGNVNKIGSSAFYGCNKISSFELTAESTTLGSAIFGTSGSSLTSGANLMGGSASESKTARVPESNVYIVEALKGMGYTVEEIPSSIEKSYETWPNSAYSEIGSPNASDVKAYYNQYSGTMTIKGTGAIKNNAYSSFTGSYSAIIKVVIEEGITEIGNAAFYNITTISSYDLPSTLTRIGNQAFYKNTSLQSITIPNSVEELGSSAFEQCTNLRSVVLSENITEIKSKTFYNCTNLLSIVIPEKVTSIGDYAFYLNYYLSDFTMLSKNITLGVNPIKDIGKKASDKVAKLDASNAYLVSAFEALGYEVTTVGETPDDIWSTYPSNMIVEVGSPNLSDVKIYYNEYSKQLDVIGTGAIQDMQGSSTSGFMNKTTTPAWEEAEIITFHEGITHIGSCLFYVTSDDALDNVVELNFPQSLESIGSSAFAYMNWKKPTNNYITEIVIPENVTEIGQNAFVGTTVDAFVLLTNDNQTVGADAFNTRDDTQTIYLYKANEGAIAEAANMSSGTEVIILDDAPTSGTTENGIKWTYDPSTKTLTFEGNGDIPTYSPESSAPWYGTGIAYNPSSYVFGSGITGVGSAFAGMGGSRIDYGNGGASGWGGAGITVYGPSSLGGAISSALPNATIKDVSEIEGEEKTGIEIFVDNNEVDFPDAQPFISDGQILAPLRFIEQDLSAKVHWVQETQEVIIDIVEWKGTENERQVQVILEVGGTTMKVNGTKYTEEDLGVGVAVLLKENRCFLPGQAIVKAWESVKFTKDYSNAPTYYADYYNIVDYENRNTDALPEGDEIVDTEELPELTPENEEELLNGVGNNFDTAIIVSAEASLFQVTVPIRVDVEMDADGVITTGSGYTVDNECPLGPVVIEEIKVVSKSTWSIADFNADYKNMKASSNKIGLSINGAEVQTNGTLVLNDSLSSVIRNKESKSLSFEAKLPAQKIAITDNALGIIFTVDFDKAE